MAVLFCRLQSIHHRLQGRLAMLLGDGEGGPDEIFEAEDGVEVVAPEQILPALDQILLPAQPLFGKDVVRVRIE